LTWNYVEPLPETIGLNLGACWRETVRRQKTQTALRLPRLRSGKLRDVGVVVCGGGGAYCSFLKINSRNWNDDEVIRRMVLVPPTKEDCTNERSTLASGTVSIIEVLTTAHGLN
jgi:hypothetical protein